MLDVFLLKLHFHISSVILINIKIMRLGKIIFIYDVYYLKYLICKVGNENIILYFKIKHYLNLNDTFYQK